MRTDSRDKKWCYFFVAAFAVYMLKSMVVGADTDEGYGIMAGFRLAQGDRLFLDMWEPHQTSAIFTAVFIKIFLLITGGSPDFLNLYLRVVFFLIHIGITFFAYRTLRSCLPKLEKSFALLLAMAFFLTTPKCIYVPEYSNLHVWFSSLMVFSLMRYYCEESKERGSYLWLALSGVFLALDVLAYPSMALLFPFCIGFIVWKHRNNRWKECAVFTLPCVLGALGFLAYIFSYMTLDELLSVIPYILGDGSHAVSGWDKVANSLRGLGTLAVMVLGCGGAAWVMLIIWNKVCRRHVDKGAFWCLWFGFWFVAETVFQVYCWFTSKYNSGYPQIAYVAVPVLGLLYGRKSTVKEKTGYFLCLFSGLNYLALMILSNWTPELLCVYLVLGLMGGFLCMREYFTERMGSRGLKLLQMTLVLFILGNIFGRCYLFIGGENANSPIYQVGGYCRSGVNAGILTSYMSAYRYNTNQETWEQMVPPGSKVLYVGTSQFSYMFGDCTVASPNTISTPTYDESLLAYWERNPERYPDVVLVEGWFGETPEYGEDSFIMQWLQNDFQPSSVEDYPYVKVFRRGK